jgi:hypothetical protein
MAHRATTPLSFTMQQPLLQHQHTTSYRYTIGVPAAEALRAHMLAGVLPWDTLPSPSCLATPFLLNATPQAFSTMLSALNMTGEELLEDVELVGYLLGYHTTEAFLPTIDDVAKAREVTMLTNDTLRVAATA